ncbi:PGPGW domain-containing protein [Ilumatobacter sp.]|uniref:PGPGW domain-containing protein n=1 Tax=Ilumatobacter sp. TaxID=1967498 RepID=UPI003B51D86E
MTALGKVGRQGKRIGVFLLGTLVVLAGIALLALPGPGVVVIIVGLLILATEFDWAQRLLDIVVERAADAVRKLQESKGGRIMLALSGVVLIAAGIVVIVVFPSFIVAGISLIIAGVIGLATLHPRVQQWIDDKALSGTNQVDDVPSRG